VRFGRLINKRLLAAGSILAVITLMLAVLPACNESTSDGIVIERRTVDDFNKVYLDASVVVDIEVGEIKSMVIAAEREALNSIETETVAGILYIESSKYFDITDRPTITITTPELLETRNHAILGGKIHVEGLKDGAFKIDHFGRGTTEIEGGTLYTLNVEQEGSGEVRISNLAVAETAEVDLQGSGNTEFASLSVDWMEIEKHDSGYLLLDEIDVEELSMNLDDSGDTLGNGIVGTMVIDKKGSGDLDLSKVMADTVQIEMTDSGDVEVWATESLSGTNSGFGELIYEGIDNPDLKNIGSGKIMPAD
jgi:hypothetical protein